MYSHSFQIVGHGHFATVWQGMYQGSVVAVKVFPTGWKQRFIMEREVYELPLMKHDGIIHFLGAGTELDGGSGLLVLEFAEYVSSKCLIKDTELSVSPFSDKSNVI